MSIPYLIGGNNKILPFLNLSLESTLENIFHSPVLVGLEGGKQNVDR